MLSNLLRSINIDYSNKRWPIFLLLFRKMQQLSKFQTLSEMKKTQTPNKIMKLKTFKLDTNSIHTMIIIHLQSM